MEASFSAVSSTSKNKITFTLIWAGDRRSLGCWEVRSVRMKKPTRNTSQSSVGHLAAVVDAGRYHVTVSSASELGTFAIPPCTEEYGRVKEVFRFEWP